MASQILRPTKAKRQKGDWQIQGSWGRRSYPAMNKVDFYQVLHRELIESGLLPADSPSPSNRYHNHVISAVMQSSSIEGRWVRDEPFASRLKQIREQASLTQEQLAQKSELDIGTVRQLEQGTRVNPTWQTVCALARGLGKGVLAFVGTDGWKAPDADR